MRTQLQLVTAVVVWLSAAGAFADEPLRVMRQVTISTLANVPAKVIQECDNFSFELPTALARENRSVSLVQKPEQLKQKTGRYLTIEIIDVRAPGGGVFSGPKKMTVRGALFDNGKEVADFQGQRSSMGSFGTCEMLERIERALAEDINKWLRNPQPGTRF